MNLVGEPYNHYNMEVFLLEAKAVWEHTCIAGGLFLLSIQTTKKTDALLQLNSYNQSSDTELSILLTIL